MSLPHAGFIFRWQALPQGSAKVRSVDDDFESDTAPRRVSVRRDDAADRGHPNQLPEVYLERLLRAYTNPGDRVCDPFGGSGTTAVVADALGRDCVTCDISPENCESILERLKLGAIRVTPEKSLR